ncbi:MAG: nitroreductase family protein [Terriglobia bacterium]
MPVMELERQTDSNPAGVHGLLERRYSPYAFSPRPVEPEKLRQLFEAARSAPSCYNEQPWRFVAARREDPEGFGRLLDTLVEQNRAWARNAPVLVLSVAKVDFTHNGQPNRHAWHDVGQAAAYLTLQATELGLYVHQMGGFDPVKARQLLNIPEGYEPAAMIAVGYPGESESLPEALRQRDSTRRPRKSLDTLIFEGTWAKPWSPAAGEGSTTKIQ